MSLWRKIILTVLIVLELSFIWGNSVLSKEKSEVISSRVMNGMNSAAEKLGLGEDFFTVMLDTDNDGILNRSDALVRKLAHLIEFASLGFLIFLRLESDGKKRFLTAWALGTLGGASDETLQFFTGRGNQLRDVLIDSVGALLGVAFIYLIVRIRAKKKRAQ